MQRFAAPYGLSMSVSEPLCTALGDPMFQLWRSDWLPPAYLPLLRAEKYVAQGIVADLKPVIDAEEVQLFHIES
jgi:RNA-directed DNA polymerase